MKSSLLFLGLGVVLAACAPAQTHQTAAPVLFIKQGQVWNVVMEQQTHRFSIDAPAERTGKNSWSFSFPSRQVNNGVERLGIFYHPAQDDAEILSFHVFRASAGTASSTLGCFIRNPSTQEDPRKLEGVLVTTPNDPRIKTYGDTGNKADLPGCTAELQ